MRRILRIFPLYFAFLFALTGYLWLFKDPSEDVSRFFSALPFYATYTSNWIPETLQEPMFGRSWSLAVEEQFYLIWPVLLVSLIFRRALLAILVFLLLSQAVDIGLFGGSLDGVAQKLAPFCAIALGVLVAMALHSRSGFDILARLLGSRFAVLLGLIALCSFLAVPGPVVGWLRVGVHVSMSVLVAAVVLREDHVLRPMLCNHPVVHIGVVSYGVYVLHGQLYGISQWLTERIGELVGFGLGENVFTFFVVFAVVSVAVATVSYRYFESVFLRIKQHYSRV